jgi:hypothetical protein
MPEICKSGSEGGGPETNRAFLPLSYAAADPRFRGDRSRGHGVWVPAFAGTTW